MINKRVRDASVSEVQIQKRKRVSNEHQHIDISCFSNDILHSIFGFFITTSGFIDGPTLRSIALVSKKWKKVVDSPPLWSIPIISPGTKNQASVNFSLGLQEVSGRSSFMGFTKLAKYGSKPGSDATVFSAKEKATGKKLILSISGSEQKACEIVNEAYQGHVALQTGFLENICSEDDSPEIDFVFTVCGYAAEETCPVWQGKPLSAHWGIDDPAAEEGTASERMQAFQQAFSQMYQRIELFLNHPIHSLERLALKKELDDIGKIQWKS